MKKRLTILGFVLIFTLVSGWLWWQINLASVDEKNNQPVMFIVQKNDGVREISSRLKEASLIRNQVAFFLLIKKLGIDQKLQAGEFRLNRAMDSQQIALALTKGMVDVWVTVLEGWRNEEIAVKLAGELALPEREFLKYSQEGYMFPDTYLIPRDASASAIVKIFKDNFEKKFTPEMETGAKAQKLTKDEIVILASIVEKEAKGEEDRNIISGILLKRLRADWPLQVDATLQYVLGYQPDSQSWWKKELLEEDKKIKSPYNTYLNVGLPPGPIANPGLAAIKAVIYPQTSDYWYYLHDADGAAHFAKTVEEHQQNINQYLK